MRRHNILRISALCVLLTLMAGCASTPPTSEATPGAAAPPKERLYGHWVGRQGLLIKQSGELIFFPDGRLVWVLNGSRLGEGWNLTYGVNTNVFPWEVDLFSKSPSDGHVNTVRMLIEMINDNEMRTGVGDDTRILPKSFKARGVSVMTFKRVN